MAHDNEKCCFEEGYGAGFLAAQEEAEFSPYDAFSYDEGYQEALADVHAAITGLIENVTYHEADPVDTLGRVIELVEGMM